MRMFKIITLLVLCSCGADPEYRNYRTSPTITNEDIDWKTVATVKVGINSSPGLRAVPTQTTVITYTELEKGQLGIDSGALSTTDNGNSLDLGSLTITSISVNKLNVCGTGGDEQCTTAAVRTYSTGSIEGFVNTTDGTYGVPITINSQVLPVTVGNAILLNTYTIPGTDKRVTETDFTDIDYPLSVDMSDAGLGDYSVTIILEVVLGN